MKNIFYLLLLSIFSACQLDNFDYLERRIPLHRHTLHFGESYQSLNQKIKMNKLYYHKTWDLYYTTPSYGPDDWSIKIPKSELTNDSSAITYINPFIFWFDQQEEIIGIHFNWVVLSQSLEFLQERRQVLDLIAKHHSDFEKDWLIPDDLVLPTTLERSKGGYHEKLHLAKNAVSYQKVKKEYKSIFPKPRQ